MSRTYKRKSRKVHFKPKSQRRDIEETVKEAGYNIFHTPRGGTFKQAVTQPHHD